MPRQNSIGMITDLSSRLGAVPRWSRTTCDGAGARYASQRASVRFALFRDGGQGRGRTADLPLFRRTLVPTELPDRVWPRAPRGSERPEAATERS